jgi:hypothetical protein
MASRYWVGGSGTWDSSSTTHWSATSGGSSGASVPSNVDDVFVDALSGSSPVITYSIGAGQCKDLNFTGAMTPTFAGGTGLTIFGILTRISAMTWTYSGIISFGSSTTGKTVTSAGGSYLNDIGFNGIGGGWTLQDALSLSSSNLTLQNGALDTNGKAVSCFTFSGSGTTARTLNLGNSAITCSQGFTLATTTNLTFNTGTSTISITGGTNKTFDGGGLTYYNVIFTSTSLTVTGSNTFNALTFTAAKTVKLTSGTTQTFTTLNALGTLGNIITIQSVTAGTPATISRNGGTVVFNYCSIKDITATGGATFNAYNSTNVSGNTGINFLGGDPPTGYAHQVMGLTITKVNVVTPSKVIGV